MLTYKDFKEIDENLFELAASTKLLGVEADEPIEIEIDGEVDINEELKGLSEYIDWLNSEDSMKKLVALFEEEGIEEEDWREHLGITYAAITIEDKGEYNAYIVINDACAINCYGKEMEWDQEMTME